ncbi:hypothetical protein T4D_9443 [Trichinella pseudospiralis]|uniref:Uncharacterized protein n=1 Tax=Trichinella pseudospiralis TaxID=6337 RepID=A0A0V1FW64_TRIPS|nr:hypothetical protein T4D_1657 [Trichinella pseudospiralis]KRY90661.1 hypothetical protein T4D_9443 [Trichinella pseudospiralis]
MYCSLRDFTYKTAEIVFSESNEKQPRSCLPECISCKFLTVILTYSMVSSGSEIKSRENFSLLNVAKSSHSRRNKFFINDSHVELTSQWMETFTKSSINEFCEMANMHGVGL